MKFLIVVSDFPKVTETFVLRNVQHYLRQGHEVGVFHLKQYRTHETVHAEFTEVTARSLTAPWLSIGAMAEFIKAPIKVAGCAAHIIRAFLGKPRHLAVSLLLVPKALALARHCHATGVDHIHAEFAGYPATVAWIASRLTGLPFSFSAHAHDIFITQDLLATKARDAQFVRAISEFNKQFLEALPEMPQDKVEVLRCGVSVPEQAPELGPRGPFRIVFVGALLPRKGVDVLLKAVAQLPADVDWHLDILGGGGQQDALRALAQDLPTDRVHFRGPQPTNVVRQSMTAAHVVVVPSRVGEQGRSEGIPVVLMEAMSLARPVIASRLSGIPELVIDGETGVLVPPDDVDALTHALIDLIEAPDHAQKLAQAGRLQVAAYFDIEKTAQQLLDRMRETTP